MREYSLKYDILSISENYCKIQLSSLPKGMGHTIGNALRRILLNELEGTAVRAFHLNNLSGIPLRCNNVVEDTATIMLTLAQLHIRRLPNESGQINTAPFILEGNNNGKNCITFGDLKTVDENIHIEILNPDIPILHAGTVVSQPTDENPTRTFMPVNIKVLVCDGVYFTSRSTKAHSSIKGLEHDIKGYDPSEIYIDCNTCYNPVERVNFYVETKQIRSDIDNIIQEMISKGIDSSKKTTAKKKKIANPVKKMLAQITNMKTKKGIPLEIENTLDTLISQLKALPDTIEGEYANAVDIEEAESSLEAYYNELVKIRDKHGLTSEIFAVLKQLNADDSKLDIIDDTPITFTTTVTDLANSLTDILRKSSLFFSASPVLISQYDVLEENSDKYTEDLVLEVKTNGCVDPFAALEQALQTLGAFIGATADLVKEHCVNTTQCNNTDLIWSTAVHELQKQGKSRLRIDEIPNLPTSLYNQLKSTEVVHIDVLEQETNDMIFGRTNMDKVVQYLEEANINVKR